jgi:hypothetical protein
MSWYRAQSLASEDPLFIKLGPTNRELFRFHGNLIVVLIVVTTIVTESINGILVMKTHVGVSHKRYVHQLVEVI